jgi:hypothetical protein
MDQDISLFDQTSPRMNQLDEIRSEMAMHGRQASLAHSNEKYLESDKWHLNFWFETASANDH